MVASRSDPINRRSCYSQPSQVLRLPAVLKKRREAFQAGGAAVTLNHKADGFEPFKKSRFHAGSTGMAYPRDLSEEAKSLHGVA
eukprot:s35_g22.t1